MGQDGLLTVKRFARWYGGVSERTVRRWIETGKIPRECVFRLGRDWRINVDRLCELNGVRARRAPPRDLERRVALARAKLYGQPPA